MMLDDLTSLSKAIEKMTTFKDLTASSLDALLEQINALEVWADQNW